MEELIEAGYVLVGLLVQPASDRIDDYIDAFGVLRWPAETWESCRSVQESKKFIADVAEQLIPESYHLRHAPEKEDRLVIRKQGRTLIQTGKIKSFPVVLLGVDYWTPLLDFLGVPVLKEAAISQRDLSQLLVTDSRAGSGGVYHGVCHGTVWVEVCEETAEEVVV
jgi:hypothetical protein